MSDLNLAESTKLSTPNAPPTRWLAGTGIIAGLSALVASSCCVLPLVLAGLGVTGVAFSGLELLAGIRPFLLGSAIVILIAGWGLFFWKKRAPVCCGEEGCARTSHAGRTIALLAIGTAIVGLAIVWQGNIEPALLKMMR